jgi:two-component system sensor histidine kinase QseC
MAMATASAACAVFLLLGLLVYRAVAASTAVQFDELLQQEAALALRYADHEYGEGEAVVPPAAAAVMPFDMMAQIGTRSGQVLYRSPGAPAAALEPTQGAGCSNLALAGRSWRACSLSSASTPLAIRVAEPLDYRGALLARTLRAVALPLLLALVLLTALIGLVTERAFRPVRRIAADLTRRSADDLSPVNTAEMPVETHALGLALNGLLERQAEVLARERRFTADAAHELRTPLAALRAQAQVAARAGSATETRSALARLQAGIDRSAHLISQLLSLAQLEPGSAYVPGQVTEVQRVVDLVLEDLEAMARERRVEITVSGCQQSLPGSSDLLYLLLRNLLENSVLNVSPGGYVALEVSSSDRDGVLTIRDDGPGIPRAERVRAFERFYRIPGSAAGGSGLGLSIVGRIVELIGGEIELTEPAAGTGLVVRVKLPFAQAYPGARSAA